MEYILIQAKKLKFLQDIDIYFAKSISISSKYSNTLMLASAIVSAYTRIGHICLPLELLTPENIFFGHIPDLSVQAWKMAGSPNSTQWSQWLLSTSAVSNGTIHSPLVINYKHIYLQRMWFYERVIANFFKKRFSIKISINEFLASSILNNYFPNINNKINWQKIAVAISITSSVAFIYGGPGTGKTSIVARLLLSLLELNNWSPLNIMMVAPTGKAAAQLSQSFAFFIRQNKLTEQQLQLLPNKAITLHSLLGAFSDNKRFFFNKNNPLYVDILIIDEASMVDIFMMFHLIDAILPHTRIFFFGDPNQLSSIEVGNIFKYICVSSDYSYVYSYAKLKELENITGYKLPTRNININVNNLKKNIVINNLCSLQKSYRFNNNLNIKILSDYVKFGKYEKFFSFFRTRTSINNINYMQLNNSTDYHSMLCNLSYNYISYILLVYKCATPSIILKEFNKFRVLCLFREGLFGVSGLNYHIENTLRSIGLLKNNFCNGNNYVGRPIMILCNSPELGIYNGDVGILLLSSDKKTIRCYFLLPDGNIKDIALSILPKYETAFVMTINKSQGSEFEKVSIVLPNTVSSILTRELLYTAITRAKISLSLYSTDDTIYHCIINKSIYYSNLVSRLFSDV